LAHPQAKISYAVWWSAYYKDNASHPFARLKEMASPALPMIICLKLLGRCVATILIVGYFILLIMGKA
jgi:hypothetical protein